MAASGSEFVTSSQQGSDQAVALYLPKELPALVFLSHRCVVTLSHPNVDVSTLSRVEVRIALALLDHGREVLRAAHNLD